MQRSVYAASFQVAPGRTGYVIVRREGSRLSRVDAPSDYLFHRAAVTRSPNTLDAEARSLSLWWRWCLDVGVDPLLATASDFARFVLALQQTPKGLSLSSGVLALPGDDRLRAATTVKLRVGHVKAFYAWAGRVDAAADVVSRRMGAFKAPRAAAARTVTRLVPDQVTTVMRADLHPRDRFLWELLYTGLREGEALGLRVEDWHPNSEIALVWACQVRGPHLHVRPRDDNPNGARQKSAPHQRVVPILPRLEAAYREWSAWAYDHLPESSESKFLLVSLSGPNRARFWSRSGLQRRWGQVFQTLPGWELATPHMLRHTFASELQDAGVDRMVIAELLGHRSPESVQVYAHGLMETMRAGVDKLADWRNQRLGA